MSTLGQAVTPESQAASLRTGRSPLYALPPASARRLRVVLVAPAVLPTWVQRFFDLVPDNPWLDLVFVPVQGATRPATSIPLDLKAFLRYESRGQCDSEWVMREPIAGETVSTQPALAADADVNCVRSAVAAARPDLVLLAGPDAWAGAVGASAEWGCWQLDESLWDAARAALAVSPPVLRGDFSTPLELRLEQPGEASELVVASSGSTNRASITRQRERVFRKVPALLMRALRHQVSDDTLVPRRRVARLRVATAGEPAGGLAGVQALLRTFAFRLKARRARKLQPCEGAWHVLLRQDGAAIDPRQPKVSRAAMLAAPEGRFWADPCIVEDAGRRFIFVEQWTSDDPKGEIACIELLPDQRIRRHGVVFEKPYHLSYPQPFRWQGDWYMTMESGQNRSVSLYRATSFPMKWEHVTDLLSGWSCVDPTLYQHEDHWYLLVNVAETGGSTWDELFLFVADRPTGPFRPHPANPVVCDVGRARPAGPVFVHEGRLIRPGQDCAPSYGAGLVFNEIVELTPTHYREEPLGRLAPDWSPLLDGTHTYSRSAGIEVLDARGVPGPECTRVPLEELTLETPVAVEDTSLPAFVPAPTPAPRSDARPAA